MAKDTRLEKGNDGHTRHTDERDARNPPPMSQITSLAMSKFIPQPAWLKSTTADHLGNILHFVSPMRSGAALKTVFSMGALIGDHGFILNGCCHKKERDIVALADAPMLQGGLTEGREEGCLAYHHLRRQ